VRASLRERLDGWSTAGGTITLLGGGAAGGLWLLASHSKWELALAIFATVVAGLGLYWMIAALIPCWPFSFADSTPAVGGTPGRRERAIKIVSTEGYWRNLEKSKNRS